LDTQETFILPL